LREETEAGAERAGGANGNGSAQAEFVERWRNAAALTDPGMVKAFTGRDLEGVPDVQGRLQLVHDEVMPAFR
jgi:hypothetical protein